MSTLEFLEHYNENCMLVCASFTGGRDSKLDGLCFMLETIGRLTTAMQLDVYLGTFLLGTLQMPWSKYICFHCTVKYYKYTRKNGTAGSTCIFQFATR